MTGRTTASTRGVRPPAAHRDRSAPVFGRRRHSSPAMVTDKRRGLSSRQRGAVVEGRSRTSDAETATTEGFSPARKQPKHRRRLPRRRRVEGDEGQFEHGRAAFGFGCEKYTAGRDPGAALAGSPETAASAAMATFKGGQFTYATGLGDVRDAKRLAPSRPHLPLRGSGS